MLTWLMENMATIIISAVLVLMTAVEAPPFLCAGAVKG